MYYVLNKSDQLFGLLIETTLILRLSPPTAFLISFVPSLTCFTFLSPPLPVSLLLIGVS